MQNKFSQTQISNFITIAGFITFMANQAGVVLEQNEVAFWISGVFTVGSIVYNYIQRYQKGDVSLGGRRLNK